MQQKMQFTDEELYRQENLPRPHGFLKKAKRTSGSAISLMYLDKLEGYGVDTAVAKKASNCLEAG